MSSEQEKRRPVSRVGETFGLTYQEDLFDRISNARLMEIISDDKTQVHSIAVDYNNYGEFLFVTVSRPARVEPMCVTFFGLGFHEQRERWTKDAWSWYEANVFANRLANKLAKDDVLKAIAERKATIDAEVNPPRSGHAKLFEMLADLTDEDGAYTELEDLGDAADWLFDDRGGDSTLPEDE